MPKFKNKVSFDVANSSVISRGQKYLLTSAAILLITLNSPLTSYANEWIGPSKGDFFDVKNWDDKLGPQGRGSSVNKGHAVGLIDLAQGADSAKIADKIGTKSGLEAIVDINLKPGTTDVHKFAHLDFGDDLEIGTRGGKGILNVDLVNPTFIENSINTLTIGADRGSYGEFNIIGTGKDAGQVPPEGPVEIQDNCAGCEPVFLIQASNDIIIGKNGGTGVLNLKGSVLGLLHHDALTIGDGIGSNGTLNVLAGGKFNDSAGGYSNYSNTPLTVGVNEGTGLINVEGTGQFDRGDAPAALLGNGLRLGDGEKSHGTVNVLSGGKVHSYRNLDAADNSTESELTYTSVGVNGGSGEVNVSGEGSVWYQSGVLNEPYLRYQEDPDKHNAPIYERITFSTESFDVATDTGQLIIGESGAGTLNISEGGVARIGSATFEVKYDKASYDYTYSLKDHKADGSLVLAKEAGSAGTLNIGGKTGAAATSAGRLMAKDIVFGEGTGLVRFNHTNTDYVFDEFDAKYLDGPSRAQVLQLKGKGTIEAASGRTIFNQDQLDFNGELKLVTGGTLQVNGDMSGATADLNLGILEGVGTVGDVSNKGLIAPGKALNATHGGTLDSIGTLTVKGNYTGNGGGVLIDAVLGDDNSKADRLVITGNTSGNSTVAVRNVGGQGADTVEGIEIITVGGQSAGEFKLIGNYTRRSVGVVVAGAHTYKLHQGSVSDPTNGHWYLRSETEDEGYQAGIPVYEAYPQFLLDLNNLPTMQQRVGNRYWNNAGNMVIAQGADAVEAYAPAQEAGSLTQTNGVWGRIEGAHTKMEPNTSTTDANYDFNAYKMQAGLDGMIYENEQGKLIAGGTVHYTHGLASVWSPYDADLGRGRIQTDGYGFGATLTWADDDGFYVDNQAQLTWYRSDLSYAGGKSQLKDGKNNGFGYALSSEVGQRFTLDQHWSLTPQAQLQYSNVDFSDFTDVFGADVSRKKGDSLRARLGLSVDYQNSWQNAQGLTNRSSVYGTVNLYNEFLSGTKVRVSTEDFINKSERFWGGVGFGGSYTWDNDKYSIYGEGSVNTSLQHFGDSYNYKGTLGMRVKW